MTYNRFIALGDSMTEGMSDQIIDGNYRGWADRVADVMSDNYQGFTYANLAVRGKLVGQVLSEQIPIAKKYIEGKSTIVSYHAGANDVIRIKYDPDKTIALYNQGVEELVSKNPTLMLFCVLEDSGQKSKRAEIWKSRFEVFNDNVRKKAAEVDAILFDPNGRDFWRDNRFVDADRLHLNPEGHRRVAQAVLERIGLPHDPDWSKKLPPAAEISAIQKLLIDANWIWSYALPWAWRRIRGRSSGDGRSPKYPIPAPWNARN